MPLHLERAGEAPAIEEGEHTVGAAIEGGTARLFFIPAQMTEALARRLAGAAFVFSDGTLWRGDEMIRAGLGPKSGRRMGHISMAGADGAIAAFEGALGVRCKIFTHINNSNPVLLEDAPERRIAEAAGWEIAWDGLELAL